jgi:hypothetical protein
MLTICPRSDMLTNPASSEVKIANSRLFL